MHVKLRHGFITRECERADSSAVHAFLLARGRPRQGALRTELERKRKARAVRA